MAQKIEAEKIVGNINTAFIVLHNTFNQSWGFSWIQQSVIPFNGKEYNCDKSDDLKDLVEKIGTDVILTVFQKWSTEDSIFTKKQLFAAVCISLKLFKAEDFTLDADTAKALKSFATWADTYYGFSKVSRTMPEKSVSTKGTGNKAKTQVIRRK